MHVIEDSTTLVAQPTMVLRGISKHYDGVAALTDVTLEIRQGEVHALLGENGAGKSTLMGVASGAVSPDAGTITGHGSPIDRLTPALATHLGIAIVHQHPAVLPDMTVAENIAVAVPSEVLGPRAGRVEMMRQMLLDVGSSAHLDDRVGQLSVAQRHLLELAKALVVKPSLLILDEPTAPLGPDSVELLFERVRRAAASGTAVVYITHRLAEVRELADRVTVLRDGKVRGVAGVDDITDDELLALIVGRQLESTFPPKPVPAEAPSDVLVVDGLSCPGFSDVSFTARRGEIIGVSGIVGNGQSDVLRALAGLEPFTGSVTLAGTTTIPARAAQAVRLPAGRPAPRGPDDVPLGAGERRPVGPRTVPLPAPARPRSRGGRRLGRARLARGQDALLRERGLRAVRRQPAEGRAGPGAAVRTADRPGRRTDAGRRRRRARRDLPDPA